MNLDVECSQLAIFLPGLWLFAHFWSPTIAAGVGVLFDSMQTLSRMRELCEAYGDAGGTGPRIAIR